MKAPSILLDTNLLLLFIVGTTSRDYISKHKRLTAFTVKDFDILMELIKQAPEVLLLPNTLTETSNLAANIGEPAKTEIFRMFHTVISNSDEQYVRSNVAADRQEFIRLGLTDSALIEASTNEVAVLTTDFNLYHAALSKGTPAINFNHLRDSYL